MLLPPPMKYSTLAFSKARLMMVGQRLLVRFIDICISYYYYSCCGIIPPPRVRFITAMPPWCAVRVNAMPLGALDGICFIIYH